MKVEIFKATTMMKTRMMKTTGEMIIQMKMNMILMMKMTMSLFMALDEDMTMMAMNTMNIHMVF